MIKWKVEEMKLMNEASNIYIGREKIYSFENTSTRKEKIEFVDSLYDNKLSYLLDLAKKYKEDEKSLSKDEYGHIRTVSLKAWIKRNDVLNLLDKDYRYGKIYRTNRYLWNINEKSNLNDDSCYDDFVDEIFHKTLKGLEYEEIRYFKEHDEYTCLKKKVMEKAEKYGTSFGLNIAWSSSDNIYINYDTSKERKITLEECRILLSKYEKLEQYIEDLSNEINFS